MPQLQHDFQKFMLAILKIKPNCSCNSNVHEQVIVRKLVIHTKINDHMILKLAAPSLTDNK